MAQNKKLNVEPIAVTSAISNLLNCSVSTLLGPIGYTQTQPYLLIKHIRALNYAASATTLTLYKGASLTSAAGSQYEVGGVSIPANSYIDVYPADSRFDAADYLTGIASQTGIVLNIAAEIGIS